MKKLTGGMAIVKKSLKTFFDKKNLIPSLKIMLTPVVIYLVLTIAIGYFQADTPADQLPSNITNLILLAVSSILMIIASVWTQAVSYKLTSNILAAKIPNIKKSLFVGFRLPLKLLGASFSIGLIILLPMILAGLATVYWGQEPILFVFALYLAVLVFTIGVFVWFSLANVVIVKKGLGVFESLSESKRLVKGRFFAVAWRLLVFMILPLLGQILISIIMLSLVQYSSSVILFLSPLFGMPFFFLYDELVA